MEKPISGGPFTQEWVISVTMVFCMGFFPPTECIFTIILNGLSDDILLLHICSFMWHICRQGAAQTLSDVTFEVRQGSRVLASVFFPYVSFLFT